MQFVADLHVHSKYSRAVSQDMVLPIMAEYAKKKGLDILATADWTHPLWLKEIQNQLEESGEGLFKLKSQISKLKTTAQNSKLEKETLFILSTEISSIYTQGGKSRRIHNLVLAPSFATVEKINLELRKKNCNLMSDGRPIIGLSSTELIELILGIDEKAMLIPCHAWTPWFSLYGSNSGFDSIEECFGEYSKYIYAVETGLSSDPEMNWRIKELENRAIISNSDAHSPAKMGRECTVFSTQSDSSKFKVSYEDITEAIRQKKEGKLRIRYTVEFYPEEGKYHFTGHRNCGVVQSPEETAKNGVICPKCGRPLTIGVMHRVQQLAELAQNSKLKTQNENSKLKTELSLTHGIEDGLRVKTKCDAQGVRWYGDPTGKHPPFVKLVPLLEIVAESLSSSVFSLKTKEAYDRLCLDFGSEFNVLLKTEVAEIEKKAGAKIAEGIAKVRRGEIVLAPGYDGEYGKVKIWTEEKGEPGNILKERAKEDRSQLSLKF